MSSLVQSLWIGDRLSAMEQLCISSFLRQGHAFHLYVYQETAGIPAGTVVLDGNRILPFYSALFGVAERRLPGGGPVAVQPVSIGYSELNGFPIGRSLRPLLAWYGDMELAPHLWSFAGLGSVKVVVEFHRTVTIDEFGSRKALSEYCRQAIGRGLADAISGRWQADSPGTSAREPANLANAPGKPV